MFAALFIGAEVVEMVSRSGGVAKTVLVILLLFSLYSWSLIFAKWSAFRRARGQNERFLAAFRKSQKISDLATLPERFRHSPLGEVCDAGYQELSHQVSGTSGKLSSAAALQRSMQIAASEQLSRMEAQLSWLATTGAATPFIGLFGTVWGIMDAFHGLGSAGAASLRAVAPGISEALITTAAGLFTAVPAVIFYNVFVHSLRELGARLDTFSMEFLNRAERHYS